VEHAAIYVSKKIVSQVPETDNVQVNPPYIHKHTATCGYALLSSVNNWTCPTIPRLWNRCTKVVQKGTHMYTHAGGAENSTNWS